jgi:hypothetical protein
MDEISNRPDVPGIEGGESLKPYQKPKLTPLGSIHSLIRATPGAGTDGSIHAANSAS